MKIIHLKFQNNNSNFKKLNNEEIVAAIGNFDGVHTGHQKLFNEAKKEAKKRGYPFAVISFDPHPRDYFSKGKHNFKITDNFEKQRLIRSFNADIFINVSFNEDLRNLEPKNFIEIILKKILNVKVIFSGKNFRFGKNRSGSLIDTGEFFKKYAIEPRSCELLETENSEVISSEFIRENIKLGDFKKIKLLLGRDWAITGKVEHGNKNGVKLGFPTANLILSDLIEPKFGVYLSNTFVMSNCGQNIISDELPSITNFGIRPTINGKKPVFETHILDIENFLEDKNLYEKRIYVKLKTYIRPEKKFSSLNDLKLQIRKDIKFAKDLHINK